VYSHKPTPGNDDSGAKKGGFQKSYIQKLQAVVGREIGNQNTRNGGKRNKEQKSAITLQTPTANALGKGKTQHTQSSHSENAQQNGDFAEEKARSGIR